MTFYACSSCGTVRNDDSQCRVCGGERFDTMEAVGGGGDSTFECEECGREFDTKRGLSTHERSHEDDGDDEE